MRTSTLSRRALAALSLVFGVLTAAVSVSTAWATYTNLTAQYTSKGTVVANGIASSSVEIFLFRDIATVQSMIDQYLDTEGVSYVYVVDPGGIALAHTFSPAVPEEVRSLEEPNRETKIQEVSIPGYGEFLDVSSPILGGKVGVVHVGMDRGLIRAAIWTAVAKQLGLLLPICGFCLLAAYALVNRLVQPLKHLTVAANKLAVGGSTAEEKFEQDAVLRRTATRADEVGQLARGFREMVLKISAREEELRTAHDQLETRVRLRTSELEQANARLQQEVDVRKRTEEALTQTARELGRSNLELEQFAYIASHDLQEPLRKVQAFGDMLHAASDLTLGEEGRDYLRRMQTAAQRMQLLISDLLNFSRITIRGNPFVAVDLAQTVREVCSDLETRIRDTKGRVELGELPVLDADPTQMRQLLQNLIGNALKYHRPQESPVVTVQSRLLPNSTEALGKEMPGEPLCELIVQDNGIGFNEKYLDRIFAPFQRLHGRGEYEGTGMGLAICRKIVERHGGTITARSAPEQGATFIVRLPLRQRKG